MKNRISLLIISITSVILIGCDNSTKSKIDLDLKSEALENSIKIIQSLIENDTLTYKTYISDTLYFIEPYEKPIQTSSISFANIFSQFDYTNYTMDDFNNSYSSKILEYNDYKNEEWASNLEYWHPNVEDYLFTASLIDGSEDFIWDDLRVFIITKKDGNWQIKALWS